MELVQTDSIQRGLFPPSSHLHPEPRVPHAGGLPSLPPTLLMFGPVDVVCSSREVGMSVRCYVKVLYQKQEVQHCRVAAQIAKYTDRHIPYIQVHYMGNIHKVRRCHLVLLRIQILDRTHE